MLARVNLELGSDQKLRREVGLAGAVKKFTLVLDIIHLNRVVL